MSDAYAMDEDVRVVPAFGWAVQGKLAKCPFCQRKVLTWIGRSSGPDQQCEVQHSSRCAHIREVYLVGEFAMVKFVKQRKRKK